MKSLEEIKDNIRYIIYELRIDKDDGFDRRQTLVKYYTSLAVSEKEICEQYICNAIKTQDEKLSYWLIRLCADAKLHDFAPCVEEVYNSKRFISNIMREQMLLTMLRVGYEPAVTLMLEFLDQITPESNRFRAKMILTATTAHADEDSFINLARDFWLDLFSYRKSKNLDTIAGVFTYHIFESNPTLLKKLVECIYRLCHKRGKQLAQLFLNEINKFEKEHSEKIGKKTLNEIKGYLEKFVVIDEARDL